MNESENLNITSSFSEKILKTWGVIMAVGFSMPIFQLIADDFLNTDSPWLNFKNQIPIIGIILLPLILSLICVPLIIKYRRSNNKVGEAFFVILFTLLTLAFIAFLFFVLYLKFLYSGMPSNCPQC